MANNNSLNNTSYGFTLPSLNLNFTSTAQRITGDMSNATHANRLSFQTNVVNGSTSPFIIPNGSGTVGQIVVANASDPTNSAFGSLQADAASVKLVSNVLGAGVQLPIEIRIGATAAINIATNLAVTIPNATAGALALGVTASASGGIQIDQANGGVQMFAVNQTSADAQPAIVSFFKSRTGGNINAADILGNIRFHGRATSSIVAAQMRVTAESIGASRVSGSIEFMTNSTAGTLAQRLNLTADGALVINTPVAALTALTVNGFATAGTYAQQNNAYVTSGLFSAFRALNVDGTAGGSCQIEVSVFNQLAATGGDATLFFGNYGGTSIKIGNDVSVNQFSMSTGNLGDANTFFTYDVATTQINKPRQCAFLAYIGADVPNCTGNGITYTLGTPTVAAPATPRLFTEVYDQSNNFNTNGTFTAPKSGRYHFNAALWLSNTGGLATAYQIRFSTTGGLIIGGQGVPNLGNGFFTATCSAYVNMVAGDTCVLQMSASGMVGDTATINGFSSTTYFGGTLVC